LLRVLVCLALCGSACAQGLEPPAFKQLRYDENYAYLRDPARRSDYLDPEKRSVTADMAHRLARLFDTTPEFWLGLQQDVDLHKAHQSAGRHYQKIRPLRRSA
jgi:hypothetical protein